jgi:DNA-binding transcriptional regulator YiaG
MIHVSVQDYPFESSFGLYNVCAEVAFDPNEHQRFVAGDSLDSIPHKIVNESSCIRQAGYRFYLNTYRDLVYRKVVLTAAQLEDIRAVLNLNSSQFATLVGVRRGSLSNFVKGRRKMPHPSQILALDRLAYELLKPGTAKIFVKGAPSIPYDKELRKAFGMLEH